jgi:N-hydroxyarylamine O-acetyltransferase
MDAPTLAPALVDRYLRLLEVPRRPPSPEALAELTAAQLIRVPFENVSKLVRLRGMGLKELPPVELHLEGIERFHLGGTCYANNFHLYTLLGALGY